MRLNRKEWTVLNSNFKEELTNVTVKPSDKLLWLGAKDGPWEIELKIPQKHIGQVLQSFHGDHNKELDVEFLLRSDPARKFKGKLRLDKIAGEALSNKEDKDEAEPVGAGLRPHRQRRPRPAEDRRRPPCCRRRCCSAAPRSTPRSAATDHPMGYSLFYGVFEFLYEKVVFFF